jgi:hypothetical protein
MTNAVAVIPQLAVIVPHEFDITFAAKATELLDRAGDYEIDSPEIRAMADADLSAAKTLKARADDARKAAKQPYMDNGRKIDGFYNQAIDWADKVISTLTPALATYDRKLAVERAEAQRKAEEATRAERQRLLDEAAKCEASGSTQAAQSLAEAAALVVAPRISTTVDKSERSTAPMVTWRHEVVDLMELVKAVAAGTAPIDALQANDTWLSKKAKADKEKFAMPGVKAHGDEGYRNTSRRAA